MSEAFVWFCVAVGDLVVWVVFSAVVVCELDDALAVSPVIAVRHRFRAVVCEEVEIELVVRVWQLVNKLHAQKLVELHTALRILDTKPVKWVSK